MCKVHPIVLCITSFLVTPKAQPAVHNRQALTVLHSALVLSLTLPPNFGLIAYLNHNVHDQKTCVSLIKIQFEHSLYA